MTLRSGRPARRNTAWRRAVTGVATTGALAAGLLIGAGTAHADVLDDIYAEYDTGSGGGQVSNLIHVAMKLRAAGFVPSKGDITDLEAAMNKRPNQVPLIDALESTVTYQRRSQARRASQGPCAESRDHRPEPPGPGPGARSQRRPQHQRPARLAPCWTNVCVTCWCVRRTAGRSCSWPMNSSTTPGCDGVYGIEAGVPVLLISEARTITDDAEHQALVDRAEP